MKVRLAKSSGYCMGVRRAVELALEAVHTRQGPIYSYGPLIHNPQALELLGAKGLTVLSPDAEAVDAARGGTIIIRAHGIPPDERAALESRGLEVIDATCPRVIRVQAIIRKHAAQGYTTIIWGFPDHPEVVGLRGHADGRGMVIQDREDVAGLPHADKVILVAQTTQKKVRFQEVADAVRARWPEALVFDTICGATERRQDEVRRLAREVQAMVVVGGHSSGNTTRLADVARDQGVRTVHLETEDELDPNWLGDAQTVGVTAGASTPNWMIKRVIRRLERLSRKGRPSFRVWVRRILRAMILSNVYAGLGAGSLCLAGALLQGAAPKAEHFGVTFFYVHAMHMLNLFLDKEASKFNDPDRALFLEKHKLILLASGAFSGIVSLAWGLMLGVKVFLLLAGLSVLGVLYAVPLVPRSWTRLTRIRRLKDIPSSKTLAVSGGWALILALIPTLTPEVRCCGATLQVGLFILLLVFIRSALGDILEIQGDRIVGRETIPIIIGEKTTLNLLHVLTAILALHLVTGWMSGLLTTLAPVLLICVVYAAAYQYLFRRYRIMGSVFFEAVIDANFILAGVLSGLWAMSG